MRSRSAHVAWQYRMAAASFWSRVRREGHNVTIGRSVLVDGGLSPPPSKIYPGTKCYMVVVAVDRKEYCGFGPAPSIAQRAAILEAYKSMCSCKNGAELGHQEPLLLEEEDGDEESLPLMSEARTPLGEVPSSRSLVHQCEDENGMLNVLLNIAQRKGVDIRLDFLFLSTEVSCGYI